MGYKARNKQAPPQPLPGSDLDRRSKSKGKKKASTSQRGDDRKAAKAPRGVGARSTKERGRRAADGPRRAKKVDAVDEDESDLEDALRQG
jgi:ribosomal RNA methyltransferase Nop2